MGIVNISEFSELYNEFYIKFDKEISTKQAAEVLAESYKKHTNSDCIPVKNRIDRGNYYIQRNKRNEIEIKPWSLSDQEFFRITTPCSRVVDLRGFWKFLNSGLEKKAA